MPNHANPPKLLFSHTELGLAILSQFRLIAVFAIVSFTVAMMITATITRQYEGLAIVAVDMRNPRQHIDHFTGSGNALSGLVV